MSDSLSFSEKADFYIGRLLQRLPYFVGQNTGVPPQTISATNLLKASFHSIKDEVAGISADLKTPDRLTRGPVDDHGSVSHAMDKLISSNGVFRSLMLSRLYIGEPWPDTKVMLDSINANHGATRQAEIDAIKNHPQYEAVLEEVRQTDVSAEMKDIVGLKSMNMQNRVHQQATKAMLGAVHGPDQGMKQYRVYAEDNKSVISQANRGSWLDSPLLNRALTVGAVGIAVASQNYVALGLMAGSALLKTKSYQDLFSKFRERGLQKRTQEVADARSMLLQMPEGSVPKGVLEHLKADHRNYVPMAFAKAIADNPGYWSNPYAKVLDSDLRTFQGDEGWLGQGLTSKILDATVMSKSFNRARTVSRIGMLAATAAGINAAHMGEVSRELFMSHLQDHSLPQTPFEPDWIGRWADMVEAARAGDLENIEAMASTMTSPADIPSETGPITDLIARESDRISHGIGVVDQAINDPRLVGALVATSSMDLTRSMFGENKGAHDIDSLADPVPASPKTADPSKLQSYYTLQETLQESEDTAEKKGPGMTPS